MKANFYQQKIIKIKQLIKVKKYDQAYKIVQTEIKMPYIPIQYIEQFHIFEEQLRQHFKKDTIKQNIISLDKIMEMLYGNDQEQNVALAHLAKYNLRTVQNKLKKRLEFWDDNFKKAFLYEILVEQSININIRINDKIVNPTKFSVLKNKEVNNAFKRIEILAFKKPYLIEPAFNELRRYLLINFPNSQTDGNNLGKIIFNIVDSMFDQQKKLSLKEQEIKNTLKIK